MVDKRKIKKTWIDNYIPTLDKDEIEWSVLNSVDFYSFLINNYYHNHEYIALPRLDGMELIPLGLTYTLFSKYHDDAKYLISYIKNKAGLYTILTCLKYYENYKTCEFSELITFANYIETNFFYKKMGLFKLTLKKFLEICNLNQFVLTTPESIEGKVCQTVSHLRDVLKRKNIMVYDDVFDLKKEYEKKLTK